MSSSENYRLYTFTANLYLSPLQCGLQTAHVVSEIATIMDHLPLGDFTGLRTATIFADWCREDKTIIICGAGNHKGVVDCWAEIERLNSALGLPAAIFREDEQSMNGMATACGVIVPQELYDAKFVKAEIYDTGNGVVQTEAYWEYVDENFNVRKYPLTHAEGQFIQHIKGFRLA